MLSKSYCTSLKKKIKKIKPRSFEEELSSKVLSGSVLYLFELDGDLLHGPINSNFIEKLCLMSRSTNMLK